jgi:lipoate-protein ligase A
MKYLELTFSDPASNLACDEALLELCESGDENGVLRVWEPENYFVVLGYSNKVSREVNVAACQRQSIPILRRFTGGGTVVQGPGCMNYALAVRNEFGGIPADLTDSYRFVLGRHSTIFQSYVSQPIQIQGISDLAIGGRKFSGNAQHRKRLCSLFHGTILLRFDIAVIAKCLPMPSKQPAYRESRSHEAFLSNLSVAPVDARQALRAAWRADETLQKIPSDRIDSLVRDRYSSSAWSFKY